MKSEYTTSYFKTKKEADSRLKMLTELGYKKIKNGRENGQWYVSFRAD